MATLILTTLASALIPAGTGAIATAAITTAATIAGALIDTALFAPKIRNEGPRLGDLDAQTSTYGQPIPRVWGEENRLAGNVIWSSGLTETKKTEKKGGIFGIGDSKSTTYSYAVSAAIAVCLGPVVSIGRIWADGKLLRDADGVQKPAAAIRVYLGTEAQDPDPLIQADVGVLETPAYRGVAYVVFEALQLADYGNRLPNMTFEVNAGQATVETIVTDLFTAAGLAPADFDAGGAAGLDVRGYVLGRSSSARGALEPLRQALFFDVAELEGCLNVFTADGPSAWRPAPGELAAHPAGSDRPQTYEFSRLGEQEMPREAVVAFVDPARDFQQNAEVYRRPTGQTEANIALELPLTLSPETAKAIAEKAMVQARRRKDRVSLSLPTRYMFVEPGDKMTLMFDDGRERNVRIERKDMFLPGRVNFDCVLDGAAVLTRALAPAATPVVPGQAVNLPGEAILQLLDLPLLRDVDDTPGFYVAAGGASAGYVGAALFRATDGVTFERFADLPGVATVGGTLQALRNDVDAEIWDEASRVDVFLDRPGQVLVSATREAVLNGANACVIGDEIIQFRTATLIAAQTYRLSGLLRGRRGTEAQIPLAATGARFVLIDGGVLRLPVALGDIGPVQSWKAVANGALETTGTVQVFTNTGRSLEPLPPVQLRGLKETSGDWTLSWRRRTRYDAPWRDSTDAVLAEASELYQVEILTAAGGAVVRTVTPATTGLVYTAAQQTTDFGAPTATIFWRVAQVSDRSGPGLFTANTFTRPVPPPAWARARSTITTAGVPPTTSTAATPQIVSGSYVSPTHPAFRFRGSAVTVSGTAGAGAALASRPRQSATQGPMPLVVEFIYDGASIEISHASLNIQLWIDDQIAFAADRGFITTSFTSEWRRFTFADARRRKLRLVMQISYFGGVRVEPGRILRPVVDQKNGRLIIQGDSFTFGAQAAPQASGFPQRLAQLFDADVWPSAVGGTGYLSDYALDPGNFKYRDRLATDVFPHNPAALLVLGGLNDRSGIDPAFTDLAFDTETDLYFASLAASLPDCRIVIGSHWSIPATNTGDAETDGRRALLKTKAAANGWPYIDMIEGATYDRAGGVLTAASGSWFTGVGDVGTPTGSGNCDLYLDADRIHPTSAGHDYLATRFLPELELALQDYN